MSQENVELLYRWYEAFRKHDNEACVRDSAAEVEIVSYLLGVGGHGLQGTRRTPALHRPVLASSRIGTPGWLKTIDHGDTVVAEIRMAGKGAGSGLEIEQTTWQVTRFRDGKLTGFTAYGDRAQALEAVGLSE